MGSEYRIVALKAFCEQEVERLEQENAQLMSERDEARRAADQVETQLRNRNTDIADLRRQLVELREEMTTEKGKVRRAYGFDNPHYFDGWTEHDHERYAQMSPPEMFNALRERDAEVERLRMELAAARIAALAYQVLSEVCRECEGTGEVDSGAPKPEGGDYYTVTCPSCDGTGKPFSGDDLTPERQARLQRYIDGGAR